MEPELIKAKRCDAWVDIVIGVSLLILYVGIVAVMFGYCPQVQTLPNGVELADYVLDSAAPTVGDWIAILLIVTLGAFWGVRLIVRARTVLMFCRIDEPETAPSTSQSSAKV